MFYEHVMIISQINLYYIIAVAVFNNTPDHSERCHASYHIHRYENC